MRFLLGILSSQLACQEKEEDVVAIQVRPDAATEEDDSPEEELRDVDQEILMSSFS